MSQSAETKTRFRQERLEGTWKDRTWVGIFGISITWLFLHLTSRIHNSPWVLTSAFIVGWLISDFGSGLLHWAGDTWGNADWPIVGDSMIRPFREHHFDPKSITLHDFFDVNGTNCLICLPMIGAACLVKIETASAPALFVSATLFSVAFWTFATNQIHKWAHKDRNPLWIRTLQKLWIILPPEEHDRHHEAPFSKYYCITSGWLNPLLVKIGFYRKAERLITRMTGALPRDEEGKAAVEIFASRAPQS
jgi:hypothetical protein